MGDLSPRCRIERLGGVIDGIGEHPGPEMVARSDLPSGVPQCCSMTESPRDVALRGLADSTAALKDWLVNGDYKSPTAFANAMDRLYTIEESFVRQLGKQSYYSARDADPNGRVVAGIVYARGLATHARGLVDEIDGSRPFAIRGGSAVRGGDGLRAGGVTLRWRPFAALPAPYRPENKNRDTFYMNHVEGRDVLDTFDDALQFFSSLP